MHTSSYSTCPYIHFLLQTGSFIRSIEELGREDVVNALLCGCSLYRIITLEESMGSELSNPSSQQPSKTENVDNLNSELTKSDKVINHPGKIGDDSFHQDLVKLPSTSQVKNSAA